MKCIAALTAFTLAFPAFLTRGQENSGPDHAMSHDMHHMSSTNSMDHMDHEMKGLYGPYPMTREASGTAWQPEASPMEGLHYMHEDWMFMLHGFAFAVYDYQSGDRGDRKFFSPNMLMGMAQHPLGTGTFGFRSLLTGFSPVSDE